MRNHTFKIERKAGEGGLGGGGLVGLGGIIKLIYDVGIPHW